MATDTLIVTEEDQDATGEYLDNRRQREIASESASFMEWATGETSAGQVPGQPGPFPTDLRPPEKQSTFGEVTRSVAEMPRQAVGGIDDAGRNAFKLLSNVAPQLNDLAEWLNDNVADLRYDPVSAPKTATGRVTRSTSEFLAGFIPALKGMKMLGAGSYVAPMAAGAISDFTVRNPHERRLADLWKSAELPENVLTDYLASENGDSEMEGRFKNALEGVVVGAALDGVVRGARAVKSMRHAKVAADKEAVETAAKAALKEQYGELTEESSKVVFGDTAAPLVQVVGGKLEEGLKAGAKVQAREITEAVLGKEQKVFINFARINSPDEVKAVMDDVAQRFAPSIKQAQRGVISHGETIRMADELGMTAAELISRRKGVPFNAEQALAARRIWGASAENLLNLAKKASDPNAGAVDVFAFRKALATHHAIQAEVIGARTETARALSAWRIAASGSIEQAKALQEIVESSGGEALGKDIAKRMVLLAEHGDKRALGEFVRKSWGATTFDAVREVWINGLLSSPTTHIVNTSSNAVIGFQQMYERGTASLIGQLRGATDSVAPGEGMAMAHGVTASIKDAFRMAWKAFKSGETGASLGKVDLPHKAAVSAETLKLSSETGLGRTVDVLGTAARVPSRLLGAEDEFFKTIGYRMELHAQALRQATQEGLKGKALGLRMEELLLHPPEHIRIAATDAALYSTFTQAPGAIGQAFIKMREKIPASTFVMPFVKTPVNIARYTFERTPFAPLVSQWRADIMAGGARADIALARMATGTAIMLTALDYADSGRISGAGPQDSGEREAMMRQGWQPYSVQVGNRWYSYNRADPLGSLLGFSADVSERVRRGEINEDDVDEWQEVLAMGITAVSKTAINKTYLRGISEFVEVMEDPDRYGEKYVSNMVSSFLPFTALSGSIERAVDPTVREANTPWESINAKVVFLSDKLPPRRNLWGEEISAESGLGKTYDMFSPVQSREIKPSPIDSEIMRLAPIGAADNVEGAAPQRIGKRTSFNGVTVNFKEWPKVYDEYVRLAGNDLKHPAFNQGAKEFLDALVSGKSAMSAAYTVRSDPMRLSMIKNVIAQYRSLAQQQILSDPKHAEFAEHVRALKEEKMRSRMPVMEMQQ